MTTINKKTEVNSKFTVGEKVKISPVVTHKSEWIIGTVIEVENNPFAGIVITVQTPDTDIFFEKEYLFQKV